MTRDREWRKTFWIEGPGKDLRESIHQRKGKAFRDKITRMAGVPGLGTQRNENVVPKELFGQAVNRDLPARA